MRLISQSTLYTWKGFCLFFLFLSLGLSLPFVSKAYSASQKNVLLLHSYHKGMLWADAVTEGVEKVLNPDNIQLTLYVEYMDTKRYSHKAHLEQLKNLYRSKYKNKKLDLIITCDDNAFKFALKHKELLFPDIPLVFCGVNYFEPMMVKEGEQITGVVEDFAVQSTLDVALKLHPRTQDVYIINDRTTTGQANKQILRQILPAFFDQDIEFHILDDLSMQELRSKLSTISDKSLVLLLSFNRDITGEVFTYRESIDLISSACPAPIYSVWAFYLGKGIVGGKLTSGEAQGEAAARLAEKILSGRDIEDLKIIEKSPNFYMFDYQQLKRFNIQQTELPPESKIVNTPKTLYSEHKALVLATLGVFVLLCIIIVSLVLNIVRRRKAEEDLQLSERKYRNVVDNANEGIAVIQNDSYIFFNKKMTVMTGYTSQELSSLPVPQSIYPEDRDFVVSYYRNRLLGKPAPQSYECRFLNQKGEPLWVHINAVRIEWEKNPATLAFLTDITERKRAEAALQVSEERYRTLVQNVPIGIYRNTPGPGGRFLMTNQFFRTMFGYETKEEIKKIKVSDLYVYPEQRQEFSDNLLQKGSVRGVELFMQRKDGTQIWCSVTARVVYVSGSQEIAYFDGTIEDISKRKEAEDQLRKLNEELEQRVIERTNELQNTNQVLQKTLTKLEEEEEAGKAIQFQLLPKEKISMNGYEFSRYLLPSTYLSGDFTDYFEIDQRYLGFYIADVSGHGISSAFVTVLLKSFISKYLEKYHQEQDNTILHTEEVLTKLNQEIYEKNLDKYLTIFYAIIDKQENQLIYTNGAQFPFPILFDTHKSQFISINNVPVGLFDFCTYTKSTLKLPREFIFFAASDGFLHVLEQTDLQEQQNYLLSLIDRKDLSVEDLAGYFSLDSRSAFPDDITFLMLKKVD